MRNKFDEQLARLNDMLIGMGGLIETAIAMAVKALQEQDILLARQAVAFDDEVDQKEKDIEALCLKLLLQQQPVARDLRLISAALKMITDMERIGDQAADIAALTVKLAGSPCANRHIPAMADATAGMVTDSIDAFVKKDLGLAEAVIRRDEAVNALFRAVKADLIALLREDSADGGQALNLLMVAKYLERIGDHAKNIAEWVVFSITGEHRQKTAPEED
ncbi:MAG: phosphate signaling complex protein PhoU [Oscillospiraceae bacterium]|nr:phosphate signaling complex protein PhoU [Oscillospiraceae bacterium]